MPIAKSIPSSEDGPGILCRTSSGDFIISWNRSKKSKPFTLWKKSASGYEKLSTADTSQELEKEAGLPDGLEEEHEKKKRSVIKKAK